MLVDQHCHGVLADDLDEAEFGALITESDRPPAAGTSPFDSALGLAVRRWCPRCSACPRWPGPPRTWRPAGPPAAPGRPAGCSPRRAWPTCWWTPG
ncbi:hypothetical protein [Kitasatospora paranensis]|uniref:hypothetical protein n=1 Tax=Kitasatospora paranensis TaxID=258053 RepID=UPI0031E59DFF